MPIWSLTKERVEKLLKQVGDKEIEIDTLIKLTKEDLWTRDLDDFIAEWRFQLDDEAKRQKKVANMGRRASKKLNIAGGVAGRKRKVDSDDDDFDIAPAKAKKTAMPKKEVGGLLSYMMPETKKTAPKAKAKAPTGTQKAAKRVLDLISEPSKDLDKEDVWMNLDGSGSDMPKVNKPKAAPQKVAAATKKTNTAPKNIDTDEDEEDVEEEIIRPAASRRPRGAATKPVSYNVDDSDSDGDDMLLDVGKMVKGISTASVSADNSRPLFSNSMSRPGSSSGLPKKSASSKPAVDSDSGDDTNYSKLAPPTTKKGPAVTARKTIPSDDDDSLEDMVSAPPKVTKPTAKASTKLAPKSKAPLPAKKVTKAAAPPPPPPEPKKMPLSPAAKAYAAKKAKAEKAAMEADSPSDDEMGGGMANEILDDEDEDEDGGTVARRPARRAASAAPKKKWVISDDEEDEDEDELEESTMQFDHEDSDY